MTESQTYCYTAEKVESVKKQEFIFALLKGIIPACFFLYWLIFKELTQAGFWETLPYLAACFVLPYYVYNKNTKHAKELTLTLTAYKISLSFVATTNVLKEIDTKEIGAVKQKKDGLEVYSKFNHKPNPLFISNGFEKFDEITQLVNDWAAKNAAAL